MIAGLLFAATLSANSMAANVHAVPHDREALRPGDWLPYVVSKLGPLEWWAFASSPSEVKREDYPSDDTYEESTAGPFPRFCFLPFRARPDAMHQLNEAIDQYQGDITWQMQDMRGHASYQICIVATGVKPPPGQNRTLISSLSIPQERQALEEAIKKALEHPFWAEPGFQKRAMADIPELGAYLETHFDLREKPSLQFDPEWLTAEGLARTPGEFEDFDEPGDITAYLVRDPQAYARSAQTSPEEATSESSSPDDLILHFGLSVDEVDALLSDLGQKDDGNGVPSLPLLSRIENPEGMYQPAEIERLLAELHGARQVVKAPQAIRCLDKLKRMATWAHKMENGIFLSVRGE